MLKHVGRLKKNKRKVIVAFKTLPGEPNSCVCVATENLHAEDHDSLIKLVESNSGQSADEFADVMARATLSGGENMLGSFHASGRMQKFMTSDIEMTPDSHTSISLDELNKLIAEQRGVSIEDLSVKEKGHDTKKPPTDAVAPSTEALPEPVNTVDPVTPLVAGENEVLTDEQLAANYRSQADRLFKEAKILREQAEALVPTKKRASKKADGEAQ
jgi:hypothetical protein